MSRSTSPLTAQATTRGASLLDVLREWELQTRPVRPETRAALAKRWAELPESARTPAQLLGRSAVGCEGTHGVFPKCDLTCSPCYHSADANKVRVDGRHTVEQVTAQMALLRRLRGPRAHAQLIGGEVSLLPADDHAAALLAMRAAGREPMSMTHGDFDHQYLLDVVLGPDGRPRFSRVSFAGHFDSLMRGRRGAVRPRTEAELNPFRRRFAQQFVDLKREHGIRSYVAHNMTVTPSNLGQVEQVVRDVMTMPFDMASFQPAAYIGDDRRWKEEFDEVSMDDVWQRIERGVGRSLPWQGVQFGDPRCNRSAVALKAGDRWAPLLDPADPRDLALRDRLVGRFGGMIFGDTPVPVVAVKLLRAAVSAPDVGPRLLGFGARLLRRAGGPRQVLKAARRRQLGFKTFVVHDFMDAERVAPAWAMMRRGETATDPRLKATQERLGACMYAMSHPETGEIVPACVQHSVLDPAENAALRQLLPLTPAAARPAGPGAIRSTRPRTVRA